METLPQPVQPLYPQDHPVVRRARTMIAERSVTSATNDLEVLVPLFVSEVAITEQMHHDQAEIVVRSAMQGLSLGAKGRDRREDKLMVRERLQQTRDFVVQALSKTTDTIMYMWDVDKDTNRGKWVNHKKTTRENHSSAALLSLLLDVERLIVVMDKLPSLVEGGKIYELLMEQMGSTNKKVVKAVLAGKSVQAAVEDQVRDEMEGEKADG